MPSFAGSVARVFLSPSFFPFWNGRGKQKGKQSKQGARKLLVRRLANREFTVEASQTGPGSGLANIQVSPCVWQTCARVCGVWVRSMQIGTAKACYELFPDMSVKTALKHAVSEGATAPLAFGGILFCSLLVPDRVVHRIYRSGISCSSFWYRYKKWEANKRFGFMKLLWWLGAGVIPLSF